MTIGVISAMDSEHRQLVERLKEKKVTSDGNFRYVEGILGSNRVILTQCGIGKVSAAAGSAELIRRFATDCVVSTGVAGGIDACLKVTDVVVSEYLVYHDVWCGEGNEYGQVQGFPAVYKGCASLLKYALSLNGAGLESRIHSGLVCTGDQPYRTGCHQRTFSVRACGGYGVRRHCTDLLSVQYPFPQLSHYQ